MTDGPGDHELHLLTGAYAADALADDERTAFEAHLQGCPACRQEVAELSATVTRLAEAAAQPAPHSLRARVLAAAARTRQLPPSGSVTDLAGTSRQSWYRQPATAAAALLLVFTVGLGGLVAAERDEAADARRTARQIAAVATDPTRTQQTVRMRNGGTGGVIAARGMAVFYARGMPRLPAGRAYQLWRMRGSESASAGVLGRGGELTGLVRGVAPGDVVGVTVEPADGSSRPTSTPVLRVRMV